MCGIWDWQSTIVKDLNDSQDPKHTLFRREIAFIAIYAFFSDNKCPLFTCLGGGCPKRTLSAFFTVFLIGRLFLRFLRWMGFEMINTKIQISINDRPSGWATFCYGDDVIMYLSNSVFFQLDLIKLNMIQQNYSVGKDQPVFNFFIKDLEVPINLLPYEYNMQDMTRF